MIGLTSKQAEVFLILKQHQSENKIVPTRGEIATIVGVTQTAIQLRIEQLKKKGAVTYIKGKSRSTQPVKGFRYLIREQNEG